MDEWKKVALVTGSSTGIGFETSLALARNGFHTYATMRKLQDSDNNNRHSQKRTATAEVLHLDVNNDKSIFDSITKINEEKKELMF